MFIYYKTLKTSLRVAGLLKMGNASASGLIRGFQGGGRSSKLSRTVGELRVWQRPLNP